MIAVRSGSGGARMSSSRGKRDAMSRPAGQLLPAQAREVLQLLQPAFFPIDLLQRFVQRGCALLAHL